MKLALAIPHVTGRPERDESLWRLRSQLGVIVRSDEEIACPSVDFYFEHHNTQPQHVWSRKIRSWLTSLQVDYCLVLEDDIEVAPRFWPIVAAMIEAADGRMIGLHTRHPEAQPLARAGRRWCSSTELVGTGYAFPQSRLTEFLKWSDDMGKDWAGSITQDTAVGVWAHANRLRIFHPIPTIIDHDSSLESSLGADHDDHEGRNPTVTWKDTWKGAGSDNRLAELEMPSFWRAGLDEAPHLVISPNHVRIG